MPEHLRALVFILAMAAVVFTIARRPACASACAPADFARRRNLWIALTLIAFLAHNVWVYTAVAAIVLLSAQRKEQNPLAMFFFVLFALPPITAELSAGVSLFALDYVRLLILTLLLPAYLALRRDRETVPFGRTTADRLLAAGMVLNVALLFEHRTFTSILRDGFFYAFTDIFLPYYVASRSLRRVEQFRDAVMSLVIAAMMLSAILIFEFSRDWLLYQSLGNVLGDALIGVNYLIRDGNLRASGSIGHAIAAGYCVAVGFGLYLGLRKAVPTRLLWGLGLLAFAAGFIGPLSRGPWVGAVAMVLVFLATGPGGAVNLAKLAVVAVLGFGALLLTPAGPVVIDYLPFVGSVDARNVVGRQVLAEVSYRVFWESPILGRYDFVDSPAIQALRGSDGMVDLVNTYVVVALGRGGVGLALFVGFFLAVLAAIFQGVRRSAGNEEQQTIGRALLGCLVGILVIIATVSPILMIPPLYWLISGLGVGYALMVKRGERQTVEAASPRTASAHGAARVLARS